MTVWIGTSWKMNKTIGEAGDWARGLVEELSGRRLGDVQPFVIPSFTAIAAVADALAADDRVLVGAQNAHWEDAGAWTGEVSVPQVADAGARMVEIGHSERREFFGETDETVRRKVAATLRHGLVALLCVGEPARVKEAGGSAAFVVEQARRALEGLDDDALAGVLIAYEPIWAIGEGGRPATADELREPFAALGQAYGHRVRGLLYGGSAGPGSAAELLAVEHVDGLFVGRAAWELEGYLQLLDLAAGRRGVPPGARGPEPTVHQEKSRGK